MVKVGKTPKQVRDDASQNVPYAPRCCD